MMRHFDRKAEMADLDREIAAFDAMRADLERDFMGKWVVFHDQKLIGTFDNFEAAAEEAVRRFGSGPYLIRQVGERPVTLSASLMYHLIYGEDDPLRLQHYRHGARQGSAR